MPPPTVAALAAYRTDVIVPLVHLRQQQGYVLRRILQVGVQCDDSLSPAMLECRHDRHVLAEIAVEQDHPCHLRAFLELLAQDRGRTVAAAVLDEQDLKRTAEPVYLLAQADEQ